MSAPTPSPGFADIVRLLPELPPLPPAPAGMAAAAAWLGQGQHQFPPQLNRARLALFCAPHGHAPAPDLPALLAPWHAQQTPTALACQGQAIDLQIYELASGAPTGDITRGPALTEAAAAHAMAYGLMLAEPGVDVLALSTVGDDMTGGTAPARAVIAALLKQEPDDAMAAAAIAANRARLTDPLTIAAVLGGYEIAAMIGAILAARLAKIPVLVEGLPALAAALVLGKLAGTPAQGRDLLAHVRATSVPGELAELEKWLSATSAGLADTIPAGAGLRSATLIARLQRML